METSTTRQPPVRHLDGRRKAAILMLALGEDAAARLCAELDDRDITTLAVGFADLGRLDAREVEQLIEEFATHVSLSIAA
jgi:flagellar motor switch protein FliG